MKTHRILLALVFAAATTGNTKANLVISEIDLVNNKVEIINTGASAVNMSGYQFCNLWKGSPAYVALSTGQIVAAQSTATTLTLPAGGILTFQLTTSFITDLQGELGLYMTGSFGSSADMVDYVAWGGDAVRDSVAAGKSPPIWANATSVTVTTAALTAGRSIQLGAGLAGNTFSDYSLAAPTIGVNQVTPTPVVTTGSASGITANSATLSGTVNAKGFSTTVTFQYGETLAYGSSIAATPSPVTGSTDTAVSAVPADLLPGKTYNFRVVGTSVNGTTLGANQTFSTPGPPSATTGGASGVTNNGATLNGSVTANGPVATVTFEYGETTSYGTTVAASPGTVSGFTNTAVSATIGSLDPGKTYHYRLVAASSIDTTQGADQTFTTATTPPAIVLTNTGVSRSGNILTVDFSGPPNILPSAWQVVGSTTLVSFPDNKTPDTTFSETPVGSGKYQALIDVTGEPTTYFVRIVLP